MKERTFLVLLLVVSFFLQFYKIDSIVPFYRDQSFDAFIVRDFLIEGKIIFLGIRIQDWGARSAPLFHYLLVPFFYIFNFHPASSAVFCSLTAFLSCFAVYFISKEIFDAGTARYSSVLYAVSPLRLFFTRLGWSPVLIFLFSVLLVHSFLKILKGRKSASFFFPFLFLCSLQFHISIVLLAPFFIIVFFQKKPKIYLKMFFSGVACSVLLYAPYIYYELNNGFINTKIILKEIFVRTGVTNLFFSLFMQFLFFISSSFIPVSISSLNLERLYFSIGAFQYIALAVFLFAFFHLKDNFLRMWFLIPSLCAFLYNITLFPHHLIVLFPPMFIIMGCFIKHAGKPGLLFFALLCAYLVYWDIYYFYRASNENMCTSLGIQEQAVSFIADELKLKEASLFYEYNNSFTCYSEKESYEYLLWHHGVDVNPDSATKIYIREFVNTPGSKNFSYISIIY